MRKKFMIASAMILASFLWTGCFPDDYLAELNNNQTQNPDNGKTDEEKPDDEKPDDEKPEDKLSYENLGAYDVLKSYVDRTESPDFKLGLAINANSFIQKGKDYNLAVENFNEMTADNAMKQSSIMRNDGSMDFNTVRNFVNAAEQAGMTIYGHTLAWHSQQATGYLNGLVQSKKVDLPPSEKGDYEVVAADFNNGSHPFIGWGNNSSIGVSNGAFKATNPSVATNDYDAQFAYDVTEPYINGITYRMTFKVKGSGTGTLSAGFQIIDGYKPAGNFPAVTFDTDWKDVEIECQCNAEGSTRLVFSYGHFAGDIYIDDFSLVATDVNFKYETLTPEEKKAVLTDAMDRWIKGMMEVTASRVSVWDAVNESISGRDDNGDGFYELESAQWGSAQNFYWQDYLGSEDYVRIVIEKARKYYAEYGGTKPLKLFINDYNLESDWDDNKKLKSLIHWIDVWESDGVTKIDGIGTQMHISYYENAQTQKSKEDHVVKMLQLMANTGKLVKISELDMGYINASGQTVATVNMTDAQHRAMAKYYEFIVSKYFEIVPPAQQYGITIWCPLDSTAELGSGWRGGEPVGLWDQNYNRKYAYAGFADGLRK